MTLYNTLSGEKENLPDGRLRLFVCGPTVYDLPHIGHARTYVAFDAMARYLRARGHSLTYLQNITDVDDKIIQRARERRVPVKKFARELERAYHEDMKRLGVTSVDRYVRASDSIPEIIAQIRVLLDKGYAYRTGKGVYFSVSLFPDYGKLSRQDIGNLEAGARVAEDVEKKNPLDFVVWKFRDGTDEYEPSWQSPWGAGRPGWHIEDTAISGKYFGAQYELHGGGADLKFPHHDSEIALQESATGKVPFVKIWLHTGFLTVNGEKMSKSLYNFMTIRDFLNTHRPEALRMLVLQHHYRSRFDYDESAAAQAEETLATLRNFINKLAFTEKKSSATEAKFGERIAAAERGFYEALDDDFHTPRALAALLGFVKEIQPRVWGLSREEARALRRLLTASLGTLGISLTPVYAPPRVRREAEKREKLRRNQQFMLSDQLREKIRTLGYEVEDTPLGPFVYAR